jgi:hypothetical protein
LYAKRERPATGGRPGNWLFSAAELVLSSLLAFATPFCRPRDRRPGKPGPNHTSPLFSTAPRLLHPQPGVAKRLNECGPGAEAAAEKRMLSPRDARPSGIWFPPLTRFAGSSVLHSGRYFLEKNG